MFLFLQQVIPALPSDLSASNHDRMCCGKKNARPRRLGVCIYRVWEVCLAQQRQNVLRNLVCLSQYGRTSRLQDIGAAHVRNFGRVISIQDT